MLAAIINSPQAVRLGREFFKYLHNFDENPLGRPDATGAVSLSE